MLTLKFKRYLTKISYTYSLEQLDKSGGVIEESAYGPVRIPSGSSSFCAIFL